MSYGYPSIQSALLFLAFRSGVFNRYRMALPTLPVFNYLVYPCAGADGSWWATAHVVIVIAFWFSLQCMP